MIKKMEGAISIFLAIILTIMMILAGVLVDGSRIRTGEAEVTNAVDSAAMSVLAGYNSVLKESFGLFALSENAPDSLKEELEGYLNKTLMTELGVDERTLGEKSYDYIKKMLVGEGQYKHVDFFNLFDFNVEEVKVTPLYNLSEKEVLKRQILEHMKYRAPKEIGEEFIDKIMAFKNLGRQSQVMKKKLEMDKELEEVRKEQERFSDAVEDINDFNYNNWIRLRLDSFTDNSAQRVLLEKEMEKKEEQLKNAEEDYREAESDGAKDSISKRISAIEDQIRDLTRQINEKDKEADRAKKELNDYINSNKAYISAAKTAIIDVKAKSEHVSGTIEAVRNEVTDDPSNFGESIRTDTAGKSKKINPSELEKYQEQLNKNQEVLAGLENLLSNVNSDRIRYDDFSTESLEEIKSQIHSIIKSREIDSQAKNFNARCNNSSIDYYVQKAPETSKSADMRKIICDMVTAQKAKDDAENNQRSSIYKPLPESEKKELPSSITGKVNSSYEQKDIIGADSQYVKELYDKMKEQTQAQGGVGNNAAAYDASSALNPYQEGTDFKNENFSKNALQAITNLGSAIKDGLVDMRDELYVDEYAIGTFRSAISDKLKDTEKDLRGILKSEKYKDFPADMDYIRSELEYILIGSSNDIVNETAVKGQILLLRFGLNTISIYTQPDKVDMAMKAAIALAGWTGVGVPIVHTLIMLAWSMAESIIDVSCLMNAESVPIFKTSQTWVLGFQGGLQNLSKDQILGQVGEHIGKPYAKKVIDYGIDYTEDKLQELVDRTKTDVVSMINAKIDFAVDRVFQPVEGTIDSFMKFSDSKYNEFADSIEARANEQIDTTIDLIETKIYEETKKAMDQGMVKDFETEIQELAKQLLDAEAEYKERIKGKSRSEIRSIRKEIDARKDAIKQNIDGKLKDAKTSLRKIVEGKVSDLIDSLSKDIDTKIKQTASKGKEQLCNYLDSLEGKAKSTGGSQMNLTKNNIKSGLLSLSYLGYIRLFLLLQNGDQKIERIGDLIQLNMRKNKGLEGFKISEYNTYIRVEAEVSMRYLFISQPFVQREFKTHEGDRHKFNVKIYKGY